MRDWYKYKNPDKRCYFSFSNTGNGYCWPFAHHVDCNPDFKHIDKICRQCEFWKEKPPWSWFRTLYILFIMLAVLLLTFGSWIYTYFDTLPK